MVTRKEVAERAGVSEAVVSYVMNNRKIVKEETRRRVQEAISELGYRPNLTARSLKTKRTRQLAVLVHYLGNPFEAGILIHMEAKAKELGYQLFFHTFQAGSEEALKNALMGRVDGLILLGQPFKRDSIENNRWAGLPIVSVMWPEGAEGAIPYVDIDWVQTYRQLIAHLRREGHERIGFMTNGDAHSPIAYRLSRFCEAMRLEGLSLAGEHVLDGGGRLEEASRRFAAALREASPRYTAIVCGNDLMAAGCLEACRKSGLRVPDDMAIAGSEDILMSSHTAPPLTSLRYPRQEAGTLAVELLESLIAGDVSVRELRPLQAELIVRASTMMQ